MDPELKASLDELRRHFDVTGESIRGEIRQVADAVLRQDERLGGIEAKIVDLGRKIDLLDAKVTYIDTKTEITAKRLNSFEEAVGRRRP